MTPRKCPAWLLPLVTLLGCSPAANNVSPGDHAGFVVQMVTPADEEIFEEWVLECQDEDIQGLSAIRISEGDWAWQVSVSVMEFVREEPLEAELVAAITAALSDVKGVREVVHEDREVWAINGTPDGESLVLSSAVVVDQFSSRTRELLDRLNSGG